MQLLPMYTRGQRRERVDAGLAADLVGINGTVVRTDQRAVVPGLLVVQVANRDPLFLRAHGLRGRGAAWREGERQRTASGQTR